MAFQSYGKTGRLCKSWRPADGKPVLASKTTPTQTTQKKPDLVPPTDISTNVTFAEVRMEKMLERLREMEAGEIPIDEYELAEIDRLLELSERIRVAALKCRTKVETAQLN